MLKGVHDERSENRKEKMHAKVCGKDGGVCARSRARRRCPSVPPGEHRTGAVVAMEAEVCPERDLGLEGYQARPEASEKSYTDRNETRDREAIAGAARNFDRTSGDEKKESLGLDGPLYGRHLTKVQRETLRAFIDESRATESVETICGYLLMHPRSYYRWKRGALNPDHGGGGGKNKITPLEEKRVVAWLKKNPEWHCRRFIRT